MDDPSQHTPAGTDDPEDTEGHNWRGFSDRNIKHDVTDVPHDDGDDPADPQGHEPS